MSMVIPRTGVLRLVLAHLELTKPRIVLLVVFTGIPALLMAARGFPAAGLFGGTIVGIALAAGSAACFNNYFDRDIDRLMRRTAGRSIPAGRVPASHAVGLGFLLAALSWLVLVGTSNVLAAAIALLSIFYYAVIYTLWLKRRTPQNIVIGGGAGASAPLIAWAAVTGTLSPAAWLLAGVVFLWTPPHFWALALFRCEDYARAGIPMLPVTHGEDETRRQIWVYTLCLVPVTLLLGPLGEAGPLYWIPAALLGAGFVLLAGRLRRAADPAPAVRMFRFSILYLFLIFVFLTVDAVFRIIQRGGLA
jgi:protoheme IX farnesyltransferase